MAGAREEYIAAGMNDYVSKPIDQRILLTKLTEIAQRKPGAKSRSVSTPRLKAAEIDIAYLDQIQAVMDPEEAHSFVQAFVDEAAERIARMAADDNLAALAGDAHALVSTAGNVGAMRVSELARGLEMACKAGDRVAAQTGMAQVAEAVGLATVELTEWLKLHPAESPG